MEMSHHFSASGCVRNLAKPHLVTSSIILGQQGGQNGPWGLYRMPRPVLALSELLNDPSP